MQSKLILFLLNFPHHISLWEPLACAMKREKQLTREVSPPVKKCEGGAHRPGHVKSNEQNHSIRHFPSRPQVTKLAPNSSHINKWLRVLVSANQQTGGSQDHLVCLHMQPILTDQSHISKVIPTLGAKMTKLWKYCLG